MTESLFDLLDVDTLGAHHHDDPDTSVEAAKTVAAKVGPQARACLDAIAASDDGLTDDELYTIVSSWPLADPITERYIAATRRGLLRDLGYVEKTDRKRLSAKGKPAYVWAITDAGRDYLASLRRAA